MQIEFHSILLRSGAEAMADNHRAYCRRRGYAHVQHAIGSPHNSARTLLVYKYSVVRQALAEAGEGAVLLFADDDAAVYSPLDALAVLGDAAHWIAQNENHRRPEGNFFMVRAGAAGLALVDGILDRLRDMPEAGVNRWAHLELDGIAAHPHDLLIDARHYPNLLFGPFGHHLPALSAYLLSFNPIAHPNAHDDRLVRIFVAHLNRTQEGGSPLFDMPGPDAQAPAPCPDYEVHQPGRPLALVMSYTPNIAHYAGWSAQNVAAYARRHGYTLHLYRDLPAALRERMAGNWIKPHLLTRHLADHQHVAWIDADILIHDLPKPLEQIMRDQPMVLARDIAGHAFNSGFMVFSNDATCRAYLERVQALIDEVQDKNGVYASGGDQPFFVAAWQALGGAAAVPLSDCVSVNSHPALHDGRSFMLHYMGYPDRFRALVMRHDAQCIAARFPALGDCR